MNHAIVRQWLQAPVRLVGEQLELLRDERDADAALRIRDNLIIPAIEKVSAIACSLALTPESLPSFEASVQSLYDIFEMPHDLKLDDNRHNELASVVWRQTTAHVYIAGAVAVRAKRFELVPTLVRRRPEWDDSYRSKFFWTRYALMLLSRLGALKTKSLVAEALAVLEESQYFMGLFGMGDSAKERATDSLCQFDMLQNIITAAQHDLNTAYPSFGFFYNKRVVPIVQDLVTSGPSRVALGGISDNKLADILWGLDQMAHREAFAGGPWWAGEWPSDINNFLSANRTPAQPA